MSRVFEVTAASIASTGNSKSGPHGIATVRAPSAAALITYGSKVGSIRICSGCPLTAIGGAPSATSASGARGIR